MTTCLFIRENNKIYLTADCLMTCNGNILSDKKNKILTPYHEFYITGCGIWQDIEFFSNKIADAFYRDNEINTYLFLKNISKEIDSSDTQIIAVYENIGYLISHNRVSVIETDFYCIGSTDITAFWNFLRLSHFSENWNLKQKILTIYDSISSVNIYTSLDHRIQECFIEKSEAI